MYELTVRYDNSDGHFRFDDAIRTAMGPGEETDSGQDIENHMRAIGFDFENDSDIAAALKDLDEILEKRFGQRKVIHTQETSEPGAKHEVLIIDRPKTALEIFDEHSTRLGWDFAIQADILQSWFGEGMIEPLLELIDEGQSTEDFAEFLADNSDGDDRDRKACLPGCPEREVQSFRRLNQRGGEAQTSCCVRKGFEWAQNEAKPSDLSRLADLAERICPTDRDNIEPVDLPRLPAIGEGIHVTDWDRWFTACDDSYTAAERLFFVLNPDRNGNREAAAEFWREPLGDREVQEFADGALMYLEMRDTNDFVR